MIDQFYKLDVFISYNIFYCEVEPIQDLSDWSGWSHCRKSCGGGMKERSRDCKNKDEGCDKDGAVSSKQIIICNTNIYPGEDQNP